MYIGREEKVAKGEGNDKVKNIKILKIIQYTLNRHPSVSYPSPQP